MEWEFIKSLEPNTHRLAFYGYDWKIPSDYMPTKYYDLFTFFFKLENALRIFVFYVLKSNFKNDWSNVQIGEPGESNLGSLFKQRKLEHEKYGYLSLGSNNPMLYLTLNELFSIITNRSLRKYFGKYISGSFEIWSYKLGEIKAIRNNLSHFREITDKDVQRVMTTIEDLNRSLFSVFKELFDEESLKMYNISSDERFFAALNFLLDHVTNSVLEIEVSRQDFLVKLSIEIKTKIISIDQYSPLEIFINYCGVRLTRLNSFLSGILPYIIYFTCDDEISPRVTNNKFSGEMTSFKICLFFDRIEFQKNYVVLFSTIKDLLNEIESDCHTIEENVEKSLKIYLSFCCNLLHDLDFTTEPILELEERQIEDWSRLNFWGNTFIDFRRFPWIEEDILCSPLR